MRWTSQIWWEDPELEFVEDGNALDKVYEESMWKEIDMLKTGRS